MTVPERCLACSHWNFTRAKCDRVLKIKLLIAHGGGEMDVQTQPGLIPAHLEAEMNAWLVDAITHAVDSWPGWREVLALRDGKECAAHQKSAAIKEFGRKLALAKPLADPDPETDVNKLFKADISLL